MYVSLCRALKNPTGSLDSAAKYDPPGPNTMAHQELAAEIMAMRVAADEAEERRIERKIVKVEFKFEPTLRENCLNLIDVGSVVGPGQQFSMNQLFNAGWSIERELKVQQQVELCYDMGTRRDGSGHITETTKAKQELKEETLLVLVRKAPRNGD